MWMSADDAARRLGVKPATLYAYVSRGVLERRRAEDGRRSLFDAGEVEELARRGRPRRPPGPAELVIESQITMLGDGRPFYRGVDVLTLAATGTFEGVAGLLWTGRIAEPGEWAAAPESFEAGVRAHSALPPDTLPLERLKVIVAALGATDPLRLNLDRDAVVIAGRNVIAGMVDCLIGDVTASGPIEARLWRALVKPQGPPQRLRTADVRGRPHVPEPGLLDALRAALILLADHELAASTLAARVAASVRADPYAVVSAGLGVLGGTLHGGASLGAEALFAEIGEPGRAARVVGGRLRRGDRIPGFGHTVYSDDQRGTYLLERVRAAAPGHSRLAVADAVLDAARRRRLPEPNVDFALATLTTVAGMIEGAGEAIFAVARTAGWLAHAIEEYEGRKPLRPRAVYVGRPPG